jgi:hypothetical protein
MRVVLLVLIVLWSATAQARWVGTAEQWAKKAIGLHVRLPEL